MFCPFMLQTLAEQAISKFVVPKLSLSTVYELSDITGDKVEDFPLAETLSEEAVKEFSRGR